MSAAIQQPPGGFAAALRIYLAKAGRLLVNAATGWLPDVRTLRQGAIIIFAPEGARSRFHRRFQGRALIAVVGDRVETRNFSLAPIDARLLRCLYDVAPRERVVICDRGGDVVRHRWRAGSAARGD